MGSERNIAVVARLKELTASQATFESKIGEGHLLLHNELTPSIGMLGPLVPALAERSVWPNPNWDHLAEGLDAAVKYKGLIDEASALTEEPIYRQMCTFATLFCGLLCVMSENEKCGPRVNQHWPRSNAYEYHTHGPVHKSMGEVDSSDSAQGSSCRVTTARSTWCGQLRRPPMPCSSRGSPVDNYADDVMEPGHAEQPSWR